MVAPLAKLVQHFPTNAKGRDFVMGDTHGCLSLVHELLEAVTFDAEADRLFLVGDLIDRGPDSIGVLALLDLPGIYAVRGNHEDILQIVARAPAEEKDRMWQWWIANGGLWARGLTDAELQAYADRIDALPYAITVGEGEDRFNVLHAEFVGPDEDLDAADFNEQVAQRMLWGRTLIGMDTGNAEDRLVIERMTRGQSITFVGHNIVNAVGRIGSHVFIDTGAFRPFGALTMVEPKTQTIWRAERPQLDGTVNDPADLTPA